jgi:hypothetical protein
MNANQQALQHFLRLAFLRTRHQQQELTSKGALNVEQKTQFTKLKILEEIIREQLSHEDIDNSASSTR